MEQPVSEAAREQASSSPDNKVSTGAEQKREPSQRQNRGRRQPNHQEDSLKQQKVYRAKTGTTPPKAKQAAAAANNDDEPRPKTARNRRTAAADDTKVDGEERKAGKSRARSTRRRRNQSREGEEDTPNPRNQRNRKGGQPKELTAQEKARKELEKKKQGMSHQYEPFAPKRTFNSRFAEYQFAEWRRRRNNLFVVVDTVVPPMPKKPLVEPDDALYHLEVARLDKLIEEENEKFEHLKGEQHETRSRMRDGQQGRNPIKEQLRELFNELGEYSQVKKAKLGETEGITQQIQSLEKEVQKVRKNVHPVYNEAEKLGPGVQALEHRLHTVTWSKQDEARLIKEIELVKNSAPFFKKIEGVRARIADLRAQREAVKKSIEPTNKIIGRLKDRIDTVKKSESVFVNEKKLKEYDLINVGKQIEDVLEKIRNLKKKKWDAKETFYGQMCDYEIEQAFVKDIEWIAKTKEMVNERAERNAKYEAERRERNDQRRKMAEEREKRQAEIQARQEERRKAQDEKKREWEQQQLEKLEENPYEPRIDLCEELIYFCARNTKKSEEDKDGPEVEAETRQAAASEETDKARAKRLEEDVKKGKVEIALSKKDRNETGSGLGALKKDTKRKARKRDGPSAFYYEDDSNIGLDYAMIQNFSRLDMSPPTQLEELTDLSKALMQLRDAMRLKGKIEQVEGKAKFTRDSSLTETEDFKALKESYAQLEPRLKARVDAISANLRVYKSAQDDESDQAEDERPRRGGRNNEERGGRGRGRREQEEEKTGEKRVKREPKKAREQIAGNMDAFPEL